MKKHIKSDTLLGYLTTTLSIIAKFVETYYIAYMHQQSLHYLVFLFRLFNVTVENKTKF